MNFFFPSGGCRCCNEGQRHYSWGPSSVSRNWFHDSQLWSAGVLLHTGVTLPPCGLAQNNIVPSLEIGQFKMIKTQSKIVSNTSDSKTAFKRECYTFIIGPGSPKDGGKGFKKNIALLNKVLLVITLIQNVQMFVKNFIIITGLPWFWL